MSPSCASRKVDELLAAKRQLELALATARLTVTAQEQFLASVLDQIAQLVSALVPAVTAPSLAPTS